jgi:hypothetical protein
MEELEEGWVTKTNKINILKETEILIKIIRESLVTVTIETLLNEL